MEQDYQVRIAEPQDAEFLADIRIRQLLDEGSAMIYDVREDIIDFYRRKISDGTYLQYILEKDGEFISTAGILFQEYPPSISWRGAHRGYVASVYTVPAYRKQGYASILIGMLIEEARKRKLGNLWLTASEEGRNLYRKAGFDDVRAGFDTYMEWYEDK